MGQLGRYGVGAELDHPGQRDVRKEGLHGRAELALGRLGQPRLATGQAPHQLAVEQQVTPLLGE